MLPAKAISTVDRLRGDMGGGRQGRGVTCEGDIDSGQIKGRHGRGETGGVLPAMVISTVDRLRGDMGGGRQGRGVTCEGDIHGGQ